MQHFTFSFILRLASVYEDKALGLNKDGIAFNSLKNKTFSQFIDHVLKEFVSGQSEHWRPQYLNCDYCGIQYDFIGRAETLTRDFQYIAKKKNFSTISSKEQNFRVNPSGGTKSKCKKAKKDVNERKISTEEKTIKYFSTLNSTQLENLFKMFDADFELFGYSVYPFVTETKHNNI